MTNIRSIYLIQLGRIRKPYKEAKDCLSSVVKLDYMGAAEFEFGALPKSLRYMMDNFERYEMSKWNGCYRKNESVLKIWHPYGDGTEKYQEYKNNLSDIFEGGRTKEFHSFRRHPPTLSDPDDFWWDIENNVMWSYDKWFMDNLKTILQGSFQLLRT